MNYRRRTLSTLRQDNFQAINSLSYVLLCSYFLTIFLLIYFFEFIPSPSRYLDTCRITHITLFMASFSFLLSLFFFSFVHFLRSIQIISSVEHELVANRQQANQI